MGEAEVAAVQSKSVRVAWDHAIFEYVAFLTVERYPEATRTTRRQHLALMAKAMPVGPWEVNEQHLRDWFAGLRGGREYLSLAAHHGAGVLSVGVPVEAGCSGAD